MAMVQALSNGRWQQTILPAGKQNPLSPESANGGSGERSPMTSLTRRINELTNENARLRESLLAERKRVVEVEEETRNRVAGELHDGPTQLISAMVMRLDYCRQLLTKNPASLADEFGDLQRIGGRAIYQLRTMLFELRPLVLDTHGLVAALAVLLERRQKDTKSTKLVLETGTFNGSGEISRQDADIEAAVFAVVREAVNNALKHARAGCVAIHLEETPTTFCAMIADDGKGFDVASMINQYGQRGSLGMINMQERAELVGGEFIVKSTPSHGTHIIVRVPKSKTERIRNRRATGRLSLPSD